MTAIRSILAITRKDFLVALSYRIAFIAAIFGSFWGLLGLRVVSKIVEGGQFNYSRTAYFDFTVIGLMFVLVLERAATAGASAARSDQVQGTLEYLSTQPLSRTILCLSWSAYAVIQSLLVSCAVVILTTLIGFRVSHVDGPVLVMTVGLTLAIFLALGNIGISIVLVFQQGAGLMALIVGIFALLGGVLYPVSELPHRLRPLIDLSPLTYALAALRSSLLSNQAATSVVHDILILIVMLVIVTIASTAAVRAAFRVAQRRGTLSTY